MDDLHRRFRRLDRIETPYLWNEALGRAADAELIRRPTFNPGMAMIAVALLLAAMAGTVAVGAWLNRTSPVPEILTYDNGMIVGHIGCGQLVTVDPVSLESRPLVDEFDGCADFSGVWSRPAWSLDGQRLAFLVSPGPRDDDAAGAWLYEPATGEQRQLMQCADCYEIDISPDGSLVAYLEWDDGQFLSVLAVDSGEERRISFAGTPGRPVFSPDGSRIAFPVVGGRSGIHVVEVGRAEDVPLGTPILLHGPVDAANLAWSPNGEWIAYTQTGRIGSGTDDDRVGAPGQAPSSGTGVVIVRADGTDARILATGPQGEGPAFPTWSADSTSIAYVTSPRGDAPNQQRNVLWTVAIDGGEPVQIYETDCCVDYGLPWSLSWSPDGEWIAFGVELADRPAESGVVLLRPDGSDVRYATGPALEPVWQPIPSD
jgi:Tol biopolymer transport system component